MEQDIKITSYKWQCLSGFWLKIIAFITMAIDHTGLLISSYYLSSSHPLVMAFRIIGRIAMPLFAFMIAEGVFHTKHFGKYALRLGIMAILVTIALIVIQYGGLSIGSGLEDAGNIFLDLLLGAVAVYCLKQKHWAIKLLSLLPLAYGVLVFSVRAYETTTFAIVHWLPYFIRTQYDWYSIAMIIGFGIVYYLSDFVLAVMANNMGVTIETLKDTRYERIIRNLLSAAVIAFFTLLFYALTLMIKFNYLDVQTYALISGALILFYSGKRGYNKKWFEYGGYVFYPLHIAILALIFYLLNL